MINATNLSLGLINQFVLYTTEIILPLFLCGPHSLHPMCIVKNSQTLVFFKTQLLRCLYSYIFGMLGPKKPLISPSQIPHCPYHFQILLGKC